MSSQPKTGGQMSFLLPLNSPRSSKSESPMSKMGSAPTGKDVSYSSVLDSLRRKGLTVTKK